MGGFPGRCGGIAALDRPTERSGSRGIKERQGAGFVLRWVVRVSEKMSGGQVPIIRESVSSLLENQSYMRTGRTGGREVGS